MPREIKASTVITELQEIGKEVLMSMQLLYPDAKGFDPNFMSNLAMQIQILRHIEELGGIGPNMREALHKMLKHEGYVE